MQLRNLLFEKLCCRYLEANYTNFWTQVINYSICELVRKFQHHKFILKVDYKVGKIIIILRKPFTIDLYFKVTQFLQYNTFATTRNAFDPMDFIAECVALRNKKKKV